MMIMNLLVLKPLDRKILLTAGAHFIAVGSASSAENDEGWVTSVAYSPNLKTFIGLGYIRRGSKRHGDIVRAVNLLTNQDIKIKLTSPHFLMQRERGFMDSLSPKQKSNFTLTASSPLGAHRTIVDGAKLVEISPRSIVSVSPF